MEAGRTRVPGRICVWQGGSVWLSRGSGTVDTHDHHAIQISLALDGPMSLATPADADWRSFAAAVVPCHQPHALRVTDALTAMVFIDPESHEGRVLTERFGEGGIVALPADLEARTLAALGRACGRPLREAELVGAAQEAIRILTDGVSPRLVVDDRIRRAIALVRERLPAPVAQEEVAEAVFLSPSRFRHLFVEETGMAFRPYVLWLRLQRALECFTAGESLTGAAYEAGFSDVAHLSRTFRRMFGVNPTAFDQTAPFPPAPSREE